MFREARRSNQFLSREEAENLLKNASCGVLSVCGDDGYPYGVPLNFVYAGGKILFHSSAVGHKVDAITKCDKVCFSVIVQDKIVSKEYTSHFISVIAFGRAKVLHDSESRRTGLMQLMNKYCADMPMEQNRREADACRTAAIIELTVEHLTAKVSKALVAK